MQATATETQPTGTVVSTLAVSSEDIDAGKETRESVSVKSEDVPSAQQEAPATEQYKLPDRAKLKGVEVSVEKEPTRKRSRSSSGSKSFSSSPPPPVDKSDSEPALRVSPSDKDSGVEGQPSSMPTGDDTLQASQAGRLSVSPVSAAEENVSPQVSPRAATVEETSLKDLEISDEEGLSDNDDDDNGTVSSKPSSPQVELGQESLQEFKSDTPIAGKNMDVIKREIPFSPVSSPASELEPETKLEDEEEGELSLRDASQQLVSKEQETDLEAEEEKERTSSPENFQNVSSDEETAAAATTDDKPAEGGAVKSELAKSQGEEKEGEVGDERNMDDTKVEVLDSACIPFEDDSIQDMGTVEEVLEVLEQKLSTDEESDESDDGEEATEVEEEGEHEGEVPLAEEEEEKGEKKEEEEGVASDIGVVSGEGVMVGVGEEEEEDMVETLSAMVHVPQATVTTEPVWSTRSCYMCTCTCR